MYITKLELVMLLAVFWAPTFLLSSVVQWRILKNDAITSKFGVRIRLISIVLLVGAEFILGFIAWISPLHRYFINLNWLGGFEIGSIPLQAGIVSATLVTVVLYFGTKVYERNSTQNTL